MDKHEPRDRTENSEQQKRMENNDSSYGQPSNRAWLKSKDKTRRDNIS